MLVINIMGICGNGQAPSLLSNSDIPKSTHTGLQHRNEIGPTDEIKIKKDLLQIPFLSKFKTKKDNPNLPREEILIRLHEKDYPFIKKSVSTVFKQFQKQSTGGKLSHTQLKRVFHESGLNPKILEDPDCPEWQFFFTFQQSTLYDLKKLILCSILINTKKIPESVQILFDLFDDENSRLLNRAKIGEILRDIFEVAVDHLPILARGDDGLDNKLTDQEICEYSSKLNAFKGRFVDEYKTILLENREDLGSVELSEALIARKDEFNILSSDWIREMILTKYMI